jgi:hypothetical protein
MRNTRNAAFIMASLILSQRGEGNGAAEESRERIIAVPLRSPDHEFDFRGCSPGLSASGIPNDPLDVDGSGGGFWDTRTDHLKAFSSPHGVACQEGEGVAFNSSLNGYIHISNSESKAETSTSSLTLEVLFKLARNPISDDTRETIVDWDVSSRDEASPPQSRLTLLNSPTTGDDVDCHCHLETQSNKDSDQSNETDSEGNWVHAVAVVSGLGNTGSSSSATEEVATEGGPKLSLFINGVLVLDTITRHMDGDTNNCGVEVCLIDIDSKGRKKDYRGVGDKLEDKLDDFGNFLGRAMMMASSETTMDDMCPHMLALKSRKNDGANIDNTDDGDNDNDINNNNNNDNDISPPVHRSFGGTIAFVRVWNDEVLTEDQISALYEHTLLAPLPVMQLPLSSHPSNHAVSDKAAAGQGGEGNSESYSQADDKEGDDDKEDEEEKEEEPCVVAVCLTGGIRAMAAPSVQRSFQQAMLQLAKNSATAAAMDEKEAGRKKKRDIKRRRLRSSSSLLDNEERIDKKMVGEGEESREEVEEEEEEEE